MKRLMANCFGIFLRNSTITIVLLDLFVQFLLIGKYLDNSVISAYAPTATDAGDYARRAQAWQTDGFDKAFGDAYRMPGYPLIILIMSFLVPAAPYLGVRLLQMCALAVSAGVIKVILEKYVSARVALLASCLYILLPIWHFVPALLAESLSLVVVVAIIFILSSLNRARISWQQIVKISILIAVATYLKPNNLILLIVVFGFLIFTLKARIIKSLSSIVLIVILLLSPWVLFANHTQPSFFGLTTNSGGNLYIGTGMVLSYDESKLAKSAIKWKVDPRNNPTDIFVDVAGQSSAQANSMMTKKAIQIWKKRPLREIGYGIDKILIAFGLKSNASADYIFGLFSVFSLIAGALLFKWRTFRAWGFTMLITALLLAFQAAIFQADRRFVVPVLFPLATVCIGIVLGHLPFLNLKRRLDRFSRSR